MPTKMTVLLTFCMLIVATATNPNDQIEKYGETVKTYQLDVPGKDPITIIETLDGDKKKDASFDLNEDDINVKNLMTHIIHDVDGNRPRCYGPSCQEGFDGEEGPQDGTEDFSLDEEKLKNYPEFSKDRLQAINALAAKLKKQKIKADRYNYMENDENEDEDEDNGKVYTTWNRLKVKQHKHPFDDKDGWVTLEPVAWSTSKISKWKPNVKKQKPNHWNEDDNRFPSDDRYTSYQNIGNGYSYSQKKPSMSRPGYINNRLHVISSSDYESEVPSNPTWNKLQQSSYPSSWSPDEGRRPHKPHNCDNDDNNSNDDAPYYGMSDSVLTDNRPTHFPYEYEALHQATIHKRPYRRPTQVVYAGTPELDTDRGSRPPHGDGQWVLLSTTKGYRNKKRQRSMNLNQPTDDQNDFGSMTSHQSVSLTVLPVDNAHTNMTTSHGGLLEVEKSFETVEESKQAMDKVHDLDISASHNRPVKTKVIKRKVSANSSPDSSSILAAVGAGMVPATMAMVVPMMLGKRRRRRTVEVPENYSANGFVYRYR